MDELAVGTVLADRFRIERRLGYGGCGCVYQATNTRLPGKRVAIKVLLEHYRDESTLIARMRREAEILALLNHAHVVDVDDFGETPNGCPFFVMQLLSGEDLEKMLCRNAGRLDFTTALSIFRQTASALSVAHLHNIVHRDLKPSNLFICDNQAFPYYVKVLDFGIAKILHDSTPLSGITVPNVPIGTAAYMSPEQALGREDIDGRSDQFALAVILWEMLAGRQAFRRGREARDVILSRVLTEPLPLLASLGLPDEPRLAAIDPVLQRAQEKKPDRRFASVDAFVEAIDNAAQIRLAKTASRTLLASPGTSAAELARTPASSQAGDVGALATVAVLPSPQAVTLGSISTQPQSAAPAGRAAAARENQTVSSASDIRQAAAGALAREQPSEHRRRLLWLPLAVLLCLAGMAQGIWRWNRQPPGQTTVSRAPQATATTQHAQPRVQAATPVTPVPLLVVPWSWAANSEPNWGNGVSAGAAIPATGSRPRIVGAVCSQPACVNVSPRNRAQAQILAECIQNVLKGMPQSLQLRLVGRRLSIACQAFPQIVADETLLPSTFRNSMNTCITERKTALRGIESATALIGQR